MCSKLENLMEYWSNGTTLQSSEESSSLLLSHLDIRCISTYFPKLHSMALPVMEFSRQGYKIRKVFA